MAGPIAAGAIFAAVSASAGGNVGKGAAIGAGVGALAALSKAAVNTSETVGALATVLTSKLMGPLKGIQEIAGQIGQFVQLANPAVMHQFVLAMNDAMAVLGHALTPIMQALTVYTRQYGDALAKLMPVLQPLFNAISDVIAGLSVGFVPMLQAIAPFLQLFVDTMTDLLRLWGHGIAFLQGVIIEFLNTLATAFGLESRFNLDKTSRGAAKRPAEVAGVAETAAKMFRDAAQNMIMRPEGGKKDNLAFMQEIATSIAEGQKVVKQIRDFVKTVAEWVEKQVGEVGGTAKDAAALAEIGGREAIKHALDLVVGTTIRRIILK